MTPAVKNTTHLMNKTLCSEKEPAKACNTQASIFDSSNSLVKNETDVFIQQKETEECAKKEKTKKILKIAGLISLGIGVVAGGIILKEHLTAKALKGTQGDIEDLWKALDDAEKYIKEHCIEYKEHGHTVIKARNGGIVDLSKLSEFVNSSTIVKYDTPEQAKQAAKNLVMKQFELPIEKQIEYGVTVKGNDVLSAVKGDARSVYDPTSYTLSESRTHDFYHNHPFYDSVDYPLSTGDIMSLICRKRNSITAYNHLGEYGRAEITDFGKIPKVAEFSKALESYIIMVLGKERTRDYYMLTEQNPQEYVQFQHKMLSEILPKFGIKYTTNYSNLKNI